MRVSLRATARWFVWLGAVVFAAVAVTVTVLTITGSVGAERWAGALEVLRGSGEAVGTAELAALREAKRESDDLRRAKQKGEAELLKSWRKLRAEEDRLEQRRKMERDILALLRDRADKERAEIIDAEKKRKAAKKEADADLARRKADLEQRASEKVKRIYRYMDALAIAADLESRMAANKDDEVAELVDAMSDRAAAEVLEAFKDPASRMKVYKALAGRREPDVPPDGP